VKVIKPPLHPNAYLSNVRNVSKGLRARSKILQILDSDPTSASRMAKATSLTYGVVMHHLKLLACEGIVDRKGGRPYYWVTTGLGQKRLAS